MRHTFVALVEDKPGVLNRVVSVFRRRTFNIESLTVGRTHQEGISRITIVVDSDKTDVARIMPYMYKLINVLQVEELTYQPHVNRDLAMVKINATPENRAAIMQLAEVFRARVVDVTNNSLIIEITGDEEKIDGFVDVLRPYGIIEMVRTGIIAMERGTSTLINNMGESQNYELPIEFKMA
ncbi:MAG: acetolactate synthase small subunit [Anaerolineaceae bacterium]|jgi:acetolactate synthase-1/3 small subunit|nr:acetolactate synthase small subunit [Anaerolineaceae bacterium]